MKTNPVITDDFFTKWLVDYEYELMLQAEKISLVMSAMIHHCNELPEGEPLSVRGLGRHMGRSQAAIYAACTIKEAWVYLYRAFLSLAPEMEPHLRRQYARALTFARMPPKGINMPEAMKLLFLGMPVRRAGWQQFMIMRGGLPYLEEGGNHLPAELSALDICERDWEIALPHI